MKDSQLLKMLGIPFLTIALGINVGCSTIQTTTTNHKTIEKSTVYNLEETVSSNIKIDAPIEEAPAYDYNKEMCAAYAVRVSRDFYGKKMTYSDAWDLAYANKKVATIKNDKHLRELIDEGSLKPGMIIGVYYPFSRYLNGKDNKGQKRKYTHLVVFAGINKENEPVFYHHFKEKMEKITLRELKTICSKLVEIIDEK